MRKRNWWKSGRIFIGNFVVYEDLLRSFLANEVYSDLLTPEGDLEDALVHMQWIGMEYATIRQAVFSSVAERWTGISSLRNTPGLYGSDLQNDRI